MQIQHANNDGNVHGGAIMRLVDEAAGIAAIRHARRRVVTVSMDDMSFLAPVYIGDLVTVRATVNDAHRTSMEVGVRVDAENIASGEWRHVASAHLVFVALDVEGAGRRRWPGCLAESADEEAAPGARESAASLRRCSASRPWRGRLWPGGQRLFDGDRLDAGPHGPAAARQSDP